MGIENICEITYATVTEVYTKNKINYLKVKRDDNGLEIEKVNILSPMAGPGYGYVYVPPVNQQVLIGILSQTTQSAVCLGCTYNAKNAPPLQVNKNANTVTCVKHGSGWEMSIEHKSGKEKLTLTTAKKDKVSIDQTKRVFSVSSSDGTNKIEVNCSSGSITINALKEIKLTVGKNNTVTINQNGVEIKGVISTKMEASTVALNGRAQTKVQGGMVAVRGNMQTSIG